MSTFINSAFWRENTVLSAEEKTLLALLHEAHALSAIRSNGSTVALKLGYEGSGGFTGGLIAALGTLGGLHAPVTTIARLFQGGPVVFGMRAKAMLDAGDTLPGWGNSFVRGKPDSKWDGVASWIAEKFPDYSAVIQEGTNLLHSRGKMVFPNPGAYTAAIANALEMPPELAPYLFIAGRLEAWAIIVSSP